MIAKVLAFVTSKFKSFCIAAAACLGGGIFGFVTDGMWIGWALAWVAFIGGLLLLGLIIASKLVKTDTAAS